MGKTTLDWRGIKNLFRLGILGAILNVAADMLLGYGAPDPGLKGLEGALSAFLDVSDARLFWSALLGLIGVSLEGLSLFAILRLMVERAPGLARIYRVCIFGYLMFAACGFHIPCLMAVFVYRRIFAADPALALDVCVRFFLYFMLPAMILLFSSLIVLIITQIRAFAKGLTPYPKWCWVFSPAFCLVILLLTAPFDQVPFANAVSTAWVSGAHLWMYAGLLAMSGKAAGARP